MYNKNLTNQASYSKDKEDKMNNKNLNSFYEDLAEKDRLYKGLIYNNLIYIEQVIYNNKFLYNRLESGYLRFYDRRLSASEWHNLKEDMIQDLIYNILEYKEDKSTESYTIVFIDFRKLLNLVQNVLYKNLKRWNKEVNLSGLESENMDIYNVLVYEEKDIDTILTNKQAVEELQRVVTPAQKKYIKKYIEEDGCYEVNMVKNRILKAAQRSPMLKELYNI